MATPMAEANENVGLAISQESFPAPVTAEIPTSLSPIEKASGRVRKLPGRKSKNGGGRLSGLLIKGLRAFNFSLF